MASRNEWRLITHVSLQLCLMNICPTPPFVCSMKIRCGNAHDIWRHCSNGCVSRERGYNRIDRELYVFHACVKNIPNAFHSGEFMTDTRPLLFRPRSPWSSMSTSKFTLLPRSRVSNERGTSENRRGGKIKFIMRSAFKEKKNRESRWKTNDSLSSGFSSFRIGGTNSAPGATINYFGKIDRQ